MSTQSSSGTDGRRGEDPGPDLAPPPVPTGSVPPDQPRRGAAAGRGERSPSRPAPTRRQLRPWPSAAGRSSGLPPLGELLGGTVLFAVVARRPDGQPSEVHVPFATEDEAETWAADSDDLGPHAVVPMRFATRRTRSS